MVPLYVVAAELFDGTPIDEALKLELIGTEFKILACCFI
jgi:hypothetical protein